MDRVTAAPSLPHDWFPKPLPTNVQIGPRSWLYSSFAFLHYRSQRPCGLRVGHDTGLYNGTFFELGPDAEVRIGDYCTLVGAIISTQGRVVIGDYVFIAHEVVIADHFAAAPGDAPPEAVRSRDPAEIIIGAKAWIGARAVILANTTIGEGAIVGAASVVRGHVPDFTVVVGNPARIVKRLARPDADSSTPR